jgi:hypothetical protein
MMNQQAKTNATEKRPAVMSAEAFAHWGVGQIAYVKPIVVSGQPLCAIFSADGQQIGLTESRDVARAAAIQHSLEPVSVH